MAGITDGDLKRLHGWPQGLDNISREDQLPDGRKGRGGATFGSLRVAENVDLDDEGKVSSRDGYTLMADLPGLHSLYSTEAFPLMLGAVDGDLVAFDTNLGRTTITALSVPDAPLSYDVSAGHVYYTNGFDSGRVNEYGERSPWAVAPPVAQPDLEISETGGLGGGTYMVAVTFADEAGRESGSTLAEEIDLATGQGIRLVNIPQPLTDDALFVRIYVSSSNGTVLFFCQEIPVGMTTFLVGVHVPGRTLETQFHEPLPPGQIVRIHNGRMFVFAHRALYWSEALHYGQGVLASNYVSFNEPGTLIEGVGQGEDAGLFLAAGDRTYYMSGPDPSKWRRRICHPSGAVPRSSTQVDQTLLGMEGSGNVPYWLDRAGQFVIGSPGGRVAPLHADRFVGPVDVESASTAMRQKGGLRHLVSSLKGGVANPMGVTDTAEAEVWRGGTRIG